MTYKHVKLTDRGYKQFKLPRKVHKEIFIHRPLNWHTSYKYYIKDDVIILHKFTSLLGVIVNTLLYPVTLILGGLNNLTEINREYYSMYNQEKTGSFGADACYRKSFKQFEQIEKIIEGTV